MKDFEAKIVRNTESGEETTDVSGEGCGACCLGWLLGLIVGMAAVVIFKSLF